MTSLKYKSYNALTAHTNQLIATEHQNVRQPEIDSDENTDTSVIFQGFECDAVFDLLTWDEVKPTLKEKSKDTIEPIKRQRREQLCFMKEKKTKTFTSRHYSDYDMEQFDELNDTFDQDMPLVEKKKRKTSQTASEPNDVFHELRSEELQYLFPNELVDTIEPIKKKRREQLCQMNEIESKTYALLRKNRWSDHAGIMKQLNGRNNPSDQNKLLVPKNETFFFRTASPSKYAFSELSSDESQSAFNKVSDDTVEPIKRKRRGGLCQFKEQKNHCPNHAGIMEQSEEHDMPEHQDMYTTNLISLQPKDISSELISDELQQSVSNQESVDTVEPMILKRRKQSCLIKGVNIVEQMIRERRDQLNKIKEISRHQKCGLDHDGIIDQLNERKNPSDEVRLLLPKNVEIPIVTKRSNYLFSKLHENTLNQFVISMKRSELSRRRLIEFERMLPQSLAR